jgi:hypothetical protein
MREGKIQRDCPIQQELVSIEVVSSMQSLSSNLHTAGSLATSMVIDRQSFRIRQRHHWDTARAVRFTGEEESVRISEDRSVNNTFI